MHVNLDERRIADTLEAVDLAGLDDQDIAGAGFEFVPVHGPQSTAFTHELNFVVRMTVRSGPAARQRAEQIDGDIDVAVIGANKLMRAALKRQILLPNPLHASPG
jgi:hypothetical protein